MKKKTATGFAILATLMCLTACGARSEGEVGGKTSWLSRCARDSDCGGESAARCVQHLCTTRCEPNDCSAVSGTACAPTDVNACVSEPTCLPSCTRQEDCQLFGNDYECVDSFCIQGCFIPEVSGENDASVPPAEFDSSGPNPSMPEPTAAGEASGETPTHAQTSGQSQETAIGGSVPTTGFDLATSSAESDVVSNEFTSATSEPSANDATSNEVTSVDSYEPPLVVDGNLLQNPDFETEVEPWYVIGDARIIRTTAEAHTGYASLACVGRTQAWEGPAVSVISLLSPATLYVMRAWVKSDSLSGGVFHIVSYAPCPTDAGDGASDSANYSQVASAFSTGDEWVLLESAPFSLKDCAPEELAVYVEGPSPGTSFYLDDVSLVEYAP